MKSYTFTIIIEKEPEDPGYYAYCPELPGCFSAGDTVEETRENMKEAIELYVETLLEDGLPIPQREADVPGEELTIALSA